MDNAQLINQDSGLFEYYTPDFIVSAVRNVLGGHIEFDPASSYTANKIVKASRYLTADGLLCEWICDTLFMNHPFSRKNNPLWIRKLVSSYESGNVGSACCITFAATSEKWFRPLHDYPQCYLSPRTNYYLADGSLKKGVTKGSVVTYLGTNVDMFYREFNEFGSVKVPYVSHS